MEKRITESNPLSKKLTKIESTKHKFTQSGLGLTKIKPQGPHGIPVKKHILHILLQGFSLTAYRDVWLYQFQHMTPTHFRRAIFSQFNDNFYKVCHVI